MQRSFVSLAVLLASALVLASSWTGQVAAEPLSVETMNKSTTPEQIPELADALAKLNKGEVEAALADMKTAVQNNPHLPPAEIIMAEIYGKSGRGDALRYWLERAIVEAPNHPEAYAMLAQDAVQSKRPAEARLLFERAYQLLGSYDGDAKRKANIQALTCQQLAGLAMNRKDWDTATGYLDELLKIRPNDTQALQMLARVLFEQGKADEALGKLKAAKTEDTKMLTPEARLAQWYEAAGDRDNAHKYMSEALKIARRDYPTRLVAADWAFKAQMFDLARQQADAALILAKEQDLDLTNTLRLAGNIALFQGDYKGAEDYLRQAVAISPSVFGVSNNLALALCEQDDQDKQKLALQYAKMNSVLFPKEMEAGSTLGRVYFRLGDLRNANAVYNKLRMSGRPLSPDTAYCIADLFAVTDRQEDAKKLLSEVVKKEGLFSHRKDAQELLKKLGGQ